jgi:hypothetical protein
MVFGGLCTAVAVVLFVAAFQRSQHRDAAAEEAQRRNAKICEEQIANGTGGDDSPCEQTFGGGANESAKGLLSAGVLLAVGLTQLIGAGRVGVTLTGPGIIIRNPLRTYRLRWSEIKGFRTEVGYRGPMSYAFGRVDLLNGDTHRIEAICAMPWEPKDTFLDRRVIDALNAELEAHADDPPDDRHGFAKEEDGDAAPPSPPGPFAAIVDELAVDGHAEAGDGSSAAEERANDAPGTDSATDDVDAAASLTDRVTGTPS